MLGFDSQIWEMEGASGIPNFRDPISSDTHASGRCGRRQTYGYVWFTGLLVLFRRYFFYLACVWGWWASVAWSGIVLGVIIRCHPSGRMIGLRIRFGRCRCLIGRFDLLACVVSKYLCILNLWRHPTFHGNNWVYKKDGIANSSRTSWLWRLSSHFPGFNCTFQIRTYMAIFCFWFTYFVIHPGPLRYNPLSLTLQMELLRCR